MGYLLTISCYLVGFSPAIAIFCTFIAKDPVRIILFVLGAFFWLLSLLASSLVFAVLSPFFDAYVFTFVVCILLQEVARVAYFLLLKKAQTGLNKITRPGPVSVAPGVTDLHNARHMLAMVCGLGMGVMAALFLTMNAFAAFSGPGTIGLPEALTRATRDVNRTGKFLPLCYALSGLLLTILHITWTIMVWDSCHKFGRSPTAFIPGAAAVVFHFFFSFLSSVNQRGFYFPVLTVQTLVLIICISYCHVIMGGTLSSLAKGIGAAMVDAVSLKSVRRRIARRGDTVVVVADEEPPLTSGAAA